MPKATKKSKLLLYDAIQEKKRRLRAEGTVYKPHEGQLPIHRSRARVRFCASANGMGKTCLSVQEAMWRAQGYNPVLEEYTPVPAVIAVVLDKPSKADEVWIPEIRKWANLRTDQLKKKGRPSTSEIQFDNGSVIRFFSHDQDPLTFESIEIDMAIFDEPFPRTIWTALRRGGRKKDVDAKYLIIGTPLAYPWLRTEIWDRWAEGELPDTDCFRATAEVNKANLSEGFLEQFSQVLTEKEKRIRMQGEFFDLDGLALSHLFDQATHLIEREEIEWEDSWPCVIAIDPHPSKKHHAILIGCDKWGNLYVLDEYADKAVPRDFAKDLLEGWLTQYRVIDIVVDSLGSADMTGGEGFSSFIQVCNDEGLRCRATTWNEKSDEDFITRVQDSLLVPDKPNNFGQTIPKLRIISDCKGIINDICNVQWQYDKKNDINKPKLDISNKDYLSCLKYGLAVNLFFKRGRNNISYATGKVYGRKARFASRR